MKKLFSLTIALALVAGLSSCSKDYNCTCTTNFGTATDSTIVFPYVNVKKADAEDACAATETTYRIVDANANCTLD